MNTTTSSANPNFSCSMDGYVSEVRQILALSLAAVAIIKSSFLYMLPLNLAISLNYAWKFLVGAGSWIGYAVAAAYFFLSSAGLGSYMCTASGYGYYVISALYPFVNFGSASS